MEGVASRGVCVEGSALVRAALQENRLSVPALHDRGAASARVTAVEDDSTFPVAATLVRGPAPEHTVNPEARGLAGLREGNLAETGPAAVTVAVTVVGRGRDARGECRDAEHQHERREASTC